MTVIAPRRSGTHCCRSTQSRWGSFSHGNSHVELPHISGILIHTPGRVRFCVTALRTSRRPMREEPLPILSCARVRRSCSRWPLPYLASKFGSVLMLPSSRKPRMLKEKPARIPIPLQRPLGILCCNSGGAWTRSGRLDVGALGLRAAAWTSLAHGCRCTTPLESALNAWTYSRVRV